MSFINEQQNRELFLLLRQYKDDEMFLEKLVELIKKILYERDNFVKNSDNQLERDETFNNIKQKIKEVFELYKNNNPDITMVDTISFVGCGRTSLAFKIGNEVLKVGKSDNDYYKNRKYNYSCVIPIIFKESYKVAEKEYYTLVITPLVYTDNIVEEEVYDAYKRLRDLGYIWNDPKIGNIGKIMCDYNYDGVEYKAGDIVIIDIEDFAYVGEETPEEVLDEITYFSYNKNTYIYEMRYIEEKKNKIK